VQGKRRTDNEVRLFAKISCIGKQSSVIIVREMVIVGVFKSKEEKETERLKKLNEKMKQYGLEKLSDEDKRETDIIITGLMGNNLIEWGTIFGGKAEDTAKLTYLHALIEQNWMIIKLLNEIKNK
jgi:hypothetical protein